MKRIRPAIPIKVRLRVVIRQIWEAGKSTPWAELTVPLMPPRERLEIAVYHLFGGVRVECDHVPPLIDRPYNPRVKKIAARYTPNANDPAHLVYRVVRDEGPATLEPGPLSHHVKTHVRGDGAERSDTARRVHQRRVDKNRDAREAVRAGQPKRRTRMKNGRKSLFVHNRESWPKGRKIRSKNNLRKKS